MHPAKTVRLVPFGSPFAPRYHKPRLSIPFTRPVRFRPAAAIETTDFSPRRFPSPIVTRCRVGRFVCRGRFLLWRDGPTERAAIRHDTFAARVIIINDTNNIDRKRYTQSVARSRPVVNRRREVFLGYLQGLPGYEPLR